MAKKNLPLKKVVLVFIWLSSLIQVSLADSTHETSFSNISSQFDSLKISDKWFAWDKAEHLGVSAFLSGVSYSIFRDFYYNKEKSSVYFSATLTFSLGLGKEFYDKKTPKGRFSYKDLAADILGIGLGLWIATR
ncbi:MAG: hypothetical protein KAX39_02560 [candidate division Zixibacteria bacterium]|nr:hypothetical protein [candidate division Zixibacteria bacterium]